MGDKKYKFQKLTPTRDAQLSVYEDAIDFVFDNPDVRNVAISGTYGAGKSSILESYEEKHKDRSFLHILLAHFKPARQDKDDNQKSKAGSSEDSEPEHKVGESVLEWKILNQLLHQIKPIKIPQTEFRVKKGVTSKNLNKFTRLVSIFIASLVFLLLRPSVFSGLTELTDNWVKTVLSILFNPYTTIPVSVIFMACSVAAIYSLIKAQMNKNIFRKISLQGNEIEMFKEQDDSYFDKYLNEVLYLFDNAEADVIVFEDIDRFDAIRIFERLREVNRLINANRKKDQENNFVPLRFFYLLRDDIFTSKERTKFFDYIIPIVPVVDRSNSYEQFLKHLMEAELVEKFDQNFLQSLSLYVDEMRILKNIYNEFIIYISRLSDTDTALDWNKMLAMVTYKNLFPKDFSELQMGKGFVFSLFAQKMPLIETALEGLKVKRDKLAEKIEWANKEILTSQEELTDVYTGKISRLPKSYGNQLTADSLAKKKQFDDELASRKQAIEDNLKKAMPELERELTVIDREISVVNSRRLKDLLNRETIDSIFADTCQTNEIGRVENFEYIKSNDYFSLLKFLLYRGFIDETYTDYMSYFYEDSISANDKTYLRTITDRRGAKYGYSLKAPQKVLDSGILRVVEFEQEETLNYDLFECLLQNMENRKYMKFIKTLVSQIKEKNNFEFMSQFYGAERATTEFIVTINDLWSEFFSAALQGHGLPTEQIRKYSIDTLYHSSKEAIAVVNIDECLSKYISESPDYLRIKEPNIDKLISGFILVGVSFVTIDYDCSDKALFDSVYQNSLYNLSFENITQMLNIKYGIENDDDIKHKNYTLIQSSANSPLSCYVDAHLSDYLEIIIKNCDNEITDDENILINLLNNNEVSDDIKERYIQLLSTMVESVTNVQQAELWPSLMERGLFKFSVNNFVQYLLKHSTDRYLCSFVNDAPTEANFSIEEGDTAEKVFNAVAVCNEITTGKYRKILVDMDYCFREYACRDISDDHMTVLIDDNILQMDEDGLKFIRENYGNHLYNYIKHNLDAYLLLIDNASFELDEAIEIISWDVDDQIKINLLGFTNEKIMIAGMGYSDAVNAYIMKNNFDLSNKASLYENYSHYGDLTKEMIRKFVVTSADINAIVDNNWVLDDTLLSILLQSDVPDRSQKNALFMMSIPRFNEETCQRHFDEMGVSELKGIFLRTGGRRKYDKTPEIIAVLNSLKRYNWIYDYQEDESTTGTGKLYVIKNKPKSSK